MSTKGGKMVVEETESSTLLSDRVPWQQIINKDYDWTKKELLNTIYWIRQILAIIIGPAFGILSVTGSTGILSFVSISLLLLFFWYGRFLQLDVEEFGQWDLATEGFGPSFALFILLWTCFYSLHFDK